MSRSSVNYTKRVNFRNFCLDEKISKIINISPCERKYQHCMKSPHSPKQLLSIWTQLSTWPPILSLASMMEEMQEIKFFCRVYNVLISNKISNWFIFLHFFYSLLFIHILCNARSVFLRPNVIHLVPSRHTNRWFLQFFILNHCHYWVMFC